MFRIKTVLLNSHQITREELENRLRGGNVIELLFGSLSVKLTNERRKNKKKNETRVGVIEEWNTISGA